MLFAILVLASIWQTKGLFKTPGMNYIVNKWFQEELKNIQAEGFDVKSIKPLTIVDIDTLIFHQDILRERKIKLHEIFDLYHKFVKYDEKRKYNTLKTANAQALRALQPFALFFSNLAIERKLWRSSRMILDKGITLVN